MRLLINVELLSGCLDIFYFFLEINGVRNLIIVVLFDDVEIVE